MWVDDKTGAGRQNERTVKYFALFSISFLYLYQVSGNMAIHVSKVGDSEGVSLAPARG